MKIRRLTIHGFGCYGDGKELLFSGDEANVVLGDNEAGKSTVVAAIYGIIFGLGEKSTEEERRYRPWSEHARYAGEVELDMDGRSLVIARDFDTNYCTVIEQIEGEARTLFDGDGNPRSRVDTSYFDTLDAELGVSSRSVVENTSLIRQVHMTVRIDAELKRMVSGAGSGDYQQALDALMRHHAELTRQNPWGADRRTDQAIELAEAEIGRLEGLRAGVRAHLARLRELDTAIETTRGKAAQIQAKRETEDALLANMERLARVQAEGDALTRTIGGIQQETAKIDKAKLRIAEIDREVEVQFRGFTDLPDDFPQRLRTLGGARAQRGAAEARVGELRAQVEELTRGIAELGAKVEQEFAPLDGLDAGFPGRLTQYHEKSERLTRVRGRADEAAARLKEVQAVVELGAQRFSGAGDDFAARCREYMAARQALADLRERQAEDLGHREAAEAERADVEARIGREFAEFAEAGDDLREQLIELNETRTEAARIQVAEQDAQQQSAAADERKRRTVPIRSAAAVLGALLGVCLGLLLSDGYAASFVLAVVLSAAGWVGASYVLGSVEKEAADLREKTNRLAADLETAERSIGEQAERLGALADFTELQDQLERLEEHRELKRRVAELDRRIGSFPDEQARGEALAAVEARLAALAEELGAVVTEAEDVSLVIGEYEAHQRAVAEAESCEGTLAAVLERDPANPQDLGVIHRLEGELEELRGKLAGMEADPDPAGVLERFARYQIVLDERKAKEALLHACAAERADVALSSAQEEVRLCEVALGPLVDGDTDLDELGQRYEAFLGLRTDRRVNEGLVSQATDEEELKADELKAVASLAANKHSIETLLADAPYLRQFLGDAVVMARETEDARSRSADLAEEQKALAEQLQQAVVEQMALNSLSVGDPWDLDEQHEALQERLERLHSREAALCVAVDTLMEVIGEYQAEHTARIGRAASTIFERVTEGRYRSVELDEQFVPAVHQERPGRLDEESLSCGTRDQLYLSLRVAVAHELADRVALPFIMDDPFASFDDARLEAARQVMQDVVAQHQVIVLTHDRRCAGWPGANVIQLAGS